MYNYIFRGVPISSSTTAYGTNHPIHKAYVGVAVLLQNHWTKVWISFIQEICRIGQDFLYISCLHKIPPYPLPDMCRICVGYMLEMSCFGKQDM